MSNAGGQYRENRGRRRDEGRGRGETERLRVRKRQGSAHRADHTSPGVKSWNMMVSFLLLSENALPSLSLL